MAGVVTCLLPGGRSSGTSTICESGLSLLCPCCMAALMPFWSADIHELSISSESACSIWLLLIIIHGKNFTTNTCLHVWRNIQIWIFLTYFDGDKTSKQNLRSPSWTSLTVHNLKSSSITVTFNSPVLFLKWNRKIL